MSTITLDELIKQGEALKSSIPKERILAYRTSQTDEFQTNYNCWKNVCKRFLAENYPNDISNADFERAIADFEKYISQAKLQTTIGVLQGYKSVPSVLKVNTSSSNKNSNKNSVNVHVSNNNSNSQQQQQSQEQRLALDLFISAIDDELTGKQRKELKAYLEETKDLPEAERKQGIVEKLKGFGKDVVTNILANIIASPSIWGGL